VKGATPLLENNADGESDAVPWYGMRRLWPLVIKANGQSADCCIVGLFQDTVPDLFIR
jgi:hypothetical protein